MVNIKHNHLGRPVEGCQEDQVVPKLAVSRECVRSSVEIEVQGFSPAGFRLTTRSILVTRNEGHRYSEQGRY